MPRKAQVLTPEQRQIENARERARYKARREAEGKTVRTTKPVVQVKPPRVKKAAPTFVIRAGARGPAYLPGDPVTTDKTRHVVCPRMPDPTYSNTHNVY